MVRIPQVEKLIGALANPFCIHGHVKFKANPALQIGDKKCGTWISPDVDALKALATPAPFGRGGETVHAESVRKALEIPGDDVKTSYSTKFVLPVFIPALDDLGAKRT